MFFSPVPVRRIPPRVSPPILLTQGITYYYTYSLLRDSSLPLSTTTFIYSIQYTVYSITSAAIESVPSLSGPRLHTDGIYRREPAGTKPFVLKVTRVVPIPETSWDQFSRDPLFPQPLYNYILVLVQVADMFDTESIRDSDY